MKNILFYISIFIFYPTVAQVADFKNIDFTMADNIAKLNEGTSLENLPLLAHNLTFKLPTEVEKFRAIYTWICLNIKGDSHQNNKITKSRIRLKDDSIGYVKWSNDYKKIAFKKLLKYKKTMCTGYAYLLKELCFLANIESEIIDGYARTAESNVEALELANHSWNAIKLNNKWYLCDPTWSSGYMIANHTFVKDYNEGYFLTDPELFANNHYPLNKNWLLNEKLIQSGFIATPIVYSEAYKHKIIPISPKEMYVSVAKNSEVIFSFKSLKTISSDQVSLIYYSGIKELPYKIYDLKNENGLIEFKHQFTKKGFFDVHLKVNNDIVATYTVDVIKSKNKQGVEKIVSIH